MAALQVKTEHPISTREHSIHIACSDCVVHPYGAIPGGYHLASQDQVSDHKEWILSTLEKWAVAKFETGYVSTHQQYMNSILDLWSWIWGASHYRGDRRSQL